jgi:hypothetical protein
MHAAPIIPAATPATGGFDPNAPADGGDLFAGLMAALFNTAQAAPVMPAAGQPQPEGAAAQGAKATGKAGDKNGSGDGPLVLPALAGKGVVGRFAVEPATAADVGETIGDRPPVLPAAVELADAEAVATKLVLPSGPQPKPAPAAQGADMPLAAPSQSSASTPPKDQPASPPPQIADQAVKPEVLAIRGQIQQLAPPPAPATLVAAQAQAAPLLAPPVAKSAGPVADAAPDRAGPAKSAKAAPSPGAALQQVALATRGETMFDEPPAGGDDDHPREGMSDDRAPQAAPGQPDASAAAARTAHAQAAVVRGSPQTVAHLSAEIARRLESQSTRFQVELEPAGLGRVDVKVEIGAAGAMTAHLNCDNAQSADALRARAGELQSALEQAGFDLSGGLSFTAGGMDQGQSDRGGGHRTASPQAMTAPASANDLPIAAPTPRAFAREGRLDIRI